MTTPEIRTVESYGGTRQVGSSHVTVTYTCGHEEHGVEVSGTYVGPSEWETTCSRFENPGRPCPRCRRRAERAGR